MSSSSFISSENLETGTAILGILCTKNERSVAILATDTLVLRRRDVDGREVKVEVDVANSPSGTWDYYHKLKYITPSISVALAGNVRTASIVVDKLRDVGNQTYNIGFKQLITTAKTFYTQLLAREQPGLAQAKTLKDFKALSRCFDCCFIFAGSDISSNGVLAFLDCIVDLEARTMSVQLHEGITLVTGGSGGNKTFRGLHEYFFESGNHPLLPNEFFGEDALWWNSRLALTGGFKIGKETGIEAALHAVTNAIVSNEDCGGVIHYTSTDFPQVFLAQPMRPESNAKKNKRNGR